MDAIPLLDLKAQYASIRDEVRDAVDRVMESQQFILGPEVEALEREVAEYCQCRHAVGVSSGTDALLVVLMALGVRPAMKSSLRPTASLRRRARLQGLALHRSSWTSIRETFNIDPAGIESKITPQNPRHSAGASVRPDGRHGRNPPDRGPTQAARD